MFLHDLQRHFVFQGQIIHMDNITIYVKAMKNKGHDHKKERKKGNKQIWNMLIVALQGFKITLE